MGYGNTYNAPGIDLIADGVYQCAKIQLLAHARAWHIYDEEFRPTQGGKHLLALDLLGNLSNSEISGKVSLVLDTPWNEPASDSELDQEAAEREMEFGVSKCQKFVYFILKGLCSG